MFPLHGGGGVPEGPRHWQDLSTGQRLRVTVPQSSSVQMPTPLPDFRTHGQRIQGEATVDEGQDSDHCHLCLFAVPVGLSRLVCNPSAVASGFLPGPTSVLPVNRVVWCYAESGDSPPGLEVLR